MSKPPPDPEFTLRGSDGPITCLLFLNLPESGGPDGERPCSLLVSGSQQGTILVWDLGTRRVRHRLRRHENSVLGLYDLSKNTGEVADYRLLSHGRDGKMLIWQISLSDWKVVDTYLCCSMNFCAAAVSLLCGCHVIAVAADDESAVLLRDAESGKSMKTLTPTVADKPGMLMALTFINSDKYGSLKVLAGYEDGSVALWDSESGTLLSKTGLHSEPVLCLDFCSELNKGLSGSADEKISVWTLDLKTYALSSLRSIDITNPGISCIRFRQDGKIFVTGGWDHKIRVYSSKSGKALVLLNYHRDTVQCTAFSSDFRLAVGSKDCRISFWNVYR